MSTDAPPYFHTLKKKDYQTVVQHARKGTYLPGDVIIREHTLTDTFCIIKTGALLIAHLERKNRELQEAYLGTVQALVNALEARDPYMKGHTEQVTLLAKGIAQRLQIDKEDLFALEIGALLHDLGKIGVPDQVLQKPGPLGPEERYQIMEHPQLGEAILRNILYLERSIPSILYHHEQIDGKGYPVGLSGQSIPLFGRIIAVADSFDAMMSDRPYRHRMSLPHAVEQLRKGIDKQFHRQVVEAFLQALEAGDFDMILQGNSQS